MKWILALFLVTLSACDEDCKHDVRLLREVDGCRVYRMDNCSDYSTYFTNCRGATSHVVPSGKTHRVINIPTEVSE